MIGRHPDNEQKNRDAQFRIRRPFDGASIARWAVRFVPLTSAAWRPFARNPHSLYSAVNFNSVAIAAQPTLGPTAHNGLLTTPQLA
jgi:hypothetical protein